MVLNLFCRVSQTRDVDIYISSVVRQQVCERPTMLGFQCHYQSGMFPDLTNVKRSFYSSVWHHFILCHNITSPDLEQPTSRTTKQCRWNQIKEETFTKCSAAERSLGYSPHGSVLSYLFGYTSKTVNCLKITGCFLNLYHLSCTLMVPLPLCDSIADGKQLPSMKTC